MRKILLMLVVLFLLVTPRSVWASGFHLSEISGIDTSSVMGGHWWFTGLAPVFKGEALSGATVNIDIDGSSNTITADSSGSWTYSSGELTAGDHQITVSSNGSSANYTLTLGPDNVDWDSVNKGTGQALPAAGVAFPTLILGIGGILGIMIGSRFVFVKK